MKPRCSYADCEFRDCCLANVPEHLDIAGAGHRNLPYSNRNRKNAVKVAAQKQLHDTTSRYEGRNRTNIQFVISTEGTNPVSAVYGAKLRRKIWLDQCYDQRPKGELFVMTIAR
jgi:hypothetical protein